MADITVVTPVVAQDQQDCWNRGLVATSELVMYFFWTDVVGGFAVIRYVKTTDGGATWGAAITIHTHASAVEIIRMDVWYDRWTPNLPSDKIHIAFGTATDVPFGFYHYTIDTADSDNLSSKHTIDATIQPVIVNLFHQISFVKDRVSALWFVVASGLEFFLYRSLDDGLTWTKVIDGADSLTGVSEEVHPFFTRQMTLLPGFTTGIGFGVPLLVVRTFDDGNNEREILLLEWNPDTLVFDKTATVANEIDITDSITSSMSAIQREGDLAVIIVWKVDAFGGNSLLSAYLPNATESTVNLVEFAVNTIFFRSPVLYADLVNGDVYLGYIKGVEGSEDIFWRRSVNSGFNWEDPIQFNVSTADYKFLFAPYSNFDVEGLFTLAYYNADTDVFLTDDNAPVPTGLFTVRTPTSGQEPVSCLTGNPF